MSDRKHIPRNVYYPPDVLEDLSYICSKRDESVNGTMINLAKKYIDKYRHLLPPRPKPANPFLDT